MTDPRQEHMRQAQRQVSAGARCGPTDMARAAHAKRVREQSDRALAVVDMMIRDLLRDMLSHLFTCVQLHADATFRTDDLELLDLASPRRARLRCFSSCLIIFIYLFPLILIVSEHSSTSLDAGLFEVTLDLAGGSAEPVVHPQPAQLERSMLDLIQHWADLVEQVAKKEKEEEEEEEEEEKEKEEERDTDHKKNNKKKKKKKKKRKRRRKEKEEEKKRRRRKQRRRKKREDEDGNGLDDIAYINIRIASTLFCSRVPSLIMACFVFVSRFFFGGLPMNTFFLFSFFFFLLSFFFLSFFFLFSFFFLSFFPFSFFFAFLFYISLHIKAAELGTGYAGTTGGPTGCGGHSKLGSVVRNHSSRTPALGQRVADSARVHGSLDALAADCQEEHAFFHRTQEFSPGAQCATCGLTRVHRQNMLLLFSPLPFFFFVFQSADGPSISRSSRATAATEANTSNAARSICLRHCVPRLCQGGGF